jgi:hypothetical protein
VQLLLDRGEEAVEVDVEEGEAVTTPASKLAGDPGAVGLESIGHTASVGLIIFAFYLLTILNTGELGGNPLPFVKGTASAVPPILPERAESGWGSELIKRGCPR